MSILRRARFNGSSTAVLDSFPAGDGAFEALQAFGSMWVTSYAGADVWRFPHRPSRLGGTQRAAARAAGIRRARLLRTCYAS